MKRQCVFIMRHHLAYVTGLNNAENKVAEAREKNDFALVKHWERELAFHGAGHFLHCIFWENMSPTGGGEPKGALLEAINKKFGAIPLLSVISKLQQLQLKHQVGGHFWCKTMQLKH